MRVAGPGGWPLVLIFAPLGCAPSLSAAGQKVQIVEVAPTHCERLGAVQASATGGHGEEINTDTARIELRNQAGELGGNVVHLESEKEEGLLMKLSGVAFRCDPTP